jgi:hypothetical protein
MFMALSKIYISCIVVGRKLKNAEIINVTSEQTVIDIDSFFDELIFTKQFMF